MIMSKLDALINKLCPNGVEYAELRTILDYEQPTQYIVETTNYNDDFETPVLTAGQSFVLGYTDEISGVYTASKENPTIIFDDFTTSFHWVNFNFKIKSSAMKMLRVKLERSNETVLRYVYYCMKNIKYEPIDHSRQWIAKYSTFSIPFPPLPIQEEIVRILDDFTELTAKLTTELTAELKARNKQYEYYLNILLSLHNYRYDSLENLCDIVDYRGKTPKKTSEGIFLVTAKNIRKGYIDYDKSQEYISIEDYDLVMRRGRPQKGDVLITTEAPCGNVAQIDNEKIALAQRVIKYRPKSKNLDATFLKYILLGGEFQTKLLSAATGGTVKGIKGSRLHKLTIPVPSLKEQQRIVDILDHCDVLYKDIINSLSTEIKARQQQYEYYRDKLLTFPKADLEV